MQFAFKVVNYSLRYPMSAEPESVVINNKALTCGHCSARTFYRRVVVMAGPTATSLGFAAAAPRATCYICSECTFVHWFADEGGDPRRRPARKP